MADLHNICCLFDGDDMQLLHLPGTSDTSLVTFDIMHARANGKSGFGIKLALKHDLDFYAVVPKRPNWYPAAEALQCADLIAKAKDRPSIGYGASMGGYGVLKYGAAATLDAALAMSPQATIDPDINGGNDTRYAKFFDADQHDAMTVTASDLSPRAHAVCDPLFAPDSFQRDLIGGKLRSVDLPFMGHKAVEAMTPASNALARLDDAFAGRTTALTDGLRTAASGTRRFAVGHASHDLAEGRAEAAFDTLIAARARAGSDDDLNVLFARVCLATARPHAAIPDMAALVEHKPHQIIFRRLLAELYDAADQPDKAMGQLATAVHQSGNGVLAVQLWRMMKRHNSPAAGAFANDARRKWPERAVQFAA